MGDDQQPFRESEGDLKNYDYGCSMVERSWNFTGVRRELSYSTCSANEILKNGLKT